MTESRVKVLFTIAGLHPESGGPSRSVPALVSALSRCGVEIEIVAHDYGHEAGTPNLPKTNAVRTTMVACDGAFQRRFQWTPLFKRVLRERSRAFGPQLVHDTGIWLSTNRAAAVVAAQLNLPRIVSPRGMLSSWAMRHKGFKKMLAWGLYQKRDLQSAAVLHATSAAEAKDFRALGLRAPVAVIANGVEMPAASKAESGTLKTENRTLLFLSRIHPKKGLLDLVTAWADVRPLGWRVVIAGHDEMNHTKDVRDAVAAAGVERDFQFVGPVESSARWGFYERADLFVLPSHSENFGIVVAEALACGVPVITTHGTPWEDLLTHRCGWWTQNGPEPLAAALRDAVSRTDEERSEMGRRGRKLVEEKYGWPGIAAQMHAVYRWMLGEGLKPDCVHELER